jgi:hypothetical protein
VTLISADRAAPDLTTVEPATAGPAADPTADPRESPAKKHASRRLRILIVVLICLSFLPYAAIPLGANTNLPLSSVAAIPVIFAALKTGLLRFRGFLILAILPCVSAYLGILIGYPLGNPKALMIWPAHIIAVCGFAACVVLVSKPFLRRVIAVALLASSFYALAQKVFLDSGSIPFLWIYQTPGYASVQDQAEIITLYIKRPFGWFPEPSFLAGTIALAICGIVILGGRLSPRDPLVAGSIVTGCLVLFFTRSGVAVIAMLPLALALAGRGRKIVTIMMTAVAMPFSIWVAYTVLGDRRGVGNSSWRDRLGSILASLDYLTQQLGLILTGVGKGSGVFLFKSGHIVPGGLGGTGRMDDLYSVLARLVFELGIPIGIVAVALPSLWLLKGARTQIGPFSAFSVVLVWFLVATFAITYDSAAWLWALPGIGLGLKFERDARDAEARRIPKVGSSIHKVGNVPANVILLRDSAGHHG